MKKIHKVCHYIRLWEANHRNMSRKKSVEHAKCKECPAWETLKHHGKVQRMCYGLAVEATNVVKFGNPWGKKYERTRASWPDRSGYTDKRRDETERESKN